jgi:DNA mismatch repair ATPase MutS
MQANLLQPLAEPATLEMRLDAVGELLAEATLRADVQVRCRALCAGEMPGTIT